MDEAVIKIIKVLVFGIVAWVISDVIFDLLYESIDNAIAASVGLIAGISAGVVKGDYTTLLGSIVAIICILSIVPLQVKSKRKERMGNK